MNSIKNGRKAIKIQKIQQNLLELNNKYRKATLENFTLSKIINTRTKESQIPSIYPYSRK